MRLIDADALFKKEREEYRNNACYISTDYEHIFAEINNSPTVCDITQIRAEIEREADYQDAYVNADVAEGLYMALETLDKYK